MENKFYRLGAAMARKYFGAHTLTQIDLKVLAEKGMRGFKGVVHVKIASGSTAGDFLEFIHKYH